MEAVAWVRKYFVAANQSAPGSVRDPVSKSKA